MALDMHVLTQKVGPLPVYGYGAIAGGVLLVVMARGGHKGAANLLNPNVAVPAAPGTPLPGGPTPPISPTTPPGTPTPAAPGYGVVGITAHDLFGNGTVGDLIRGLGPDYQQFDFHAGDAGVDVTHSAQNIQDTQRLQDAQLSALGQMRLANDFSLSQTGMANAFSIASIMANTNAYNSITETNAQAYATRTNADSGYLDTFGKWHFNQFNTAHGGYDQGYAPAPGGGNPGPAPQQPAAPARSCSSGNFSCIRGFCGHGDNACAASVASWWRPAMGF